LLAQGGDLLLDRRREIGVEAVSQHDLPGDGLEVDVGLVVHDFRVFLPAPKGAVISERNGAPKGAP
jgi:hypothetical protein